MVAVFEDGWFRGGCEGGVGVDEPGDTETELGSGLTPTWGGCDVHGHESRSACCREDRHCCLSGSNALRLQGRCHPLYHMRVYAHDQLRVCPSLGHAEGAGTVAGSCPFSARLVDRMDGGDGGESRQDRDAVAEVLERVRLTDHDGTVHVSRGKLHVNQAVCHSQGAAVLRVDAHVGTVLSGDTILTGDDTVGAGRLSQQTGTVQDETADDEDADADETADDHLRKVTEDEAVDATGEAVVTVTSGEGRTVRVAEVLVADRHEGKPSLAGSSF